MEELQQTSMQYVMEYWPFVVAIVLAAAKVINNKTKHWQEQNWYMKAFGLAVEVLDMYRPPEIKAKK